MGNMRFIPRSCRQESTILVRNIEWLTLFNQEAIRRIFNDFVQTPWKLQLAIARFLNQNPHITKFSVFHEGLELQVDGSELSISFQSQVLKQVLPLYPLKDSLLDLANFDFGIWERLDALSDVGIIHAFDNYFLESFTEIELEIKTSSCLEFESGITLSLLDDVLLISKDGMILRRYQCTTQ